MSKTILLQALAASVCVLASAAHAQRPMTLMDAALNSLPPPRMAAGESAPPCRKRERNTPGPRPRYASPEVEARMNAADYPLGGQLSPQHRLVNDWIQRHFPRDWVTCDLDYDFGVAKLQAALGHEATGVLSMADADKLQATWAAANQTVAEVRDGRADLKAGRPKVLADFLPRPSGNFDHACGSVDNRRRMQNQQETARRVAQLPPNMMRSGVTGGIANDVERESQAVAPEWAEFWQQNPVMAEWTRANDCDRAILRTQVEMWQLALGVAPNARDTRAIARSTAAVAKSRQDDAQYQSSQEALLQAEAVRSGETARVRVWELGTLGARTVLADISDKLPSALCSVTAALVRCEKPVPCAAEQRAAAAAQGQQRINGLLRPLDPFAAPSPAIGAANITRAQTEDALRICQRKFGYTAAAASRLMFEGHELQAAELAFDTRGLTTLRLSAGNAAEALRTVLSQRYGSPDSQAVNRERYETRDVGGGTARTVSGQEVQMASRIERVPVRYTVTRYVWRTPGVLVEEATGEVLFRFSGR